MKTNVCNLMKQTAVILAKTVAVAVFLLFVSGQVNKAYVGLKHVIADVCAAIR